MQMKMDRLMQRAETAASRTAAEVSALHPEKMRFGPFVFEPTPQNIQVNHRAILRESVTVSGEEHTARVGTGRSCVTGKGTFLGPDAMTRMEALERLFGEAHTLFLPGMAPFPAILSALSVVGTPSPNCVEYTVSFSETGEVPAGVFGCTFLAAEGESLWDYAYFSGVTVDALVRANPHIKCIGDLKAGEAVHIP